jgi:curved DNA-binding protein CbpA
MANNQIKDYFKILGITSKDLETSDPKKVIRSAFRKKALQYHPDINNEKDAEDMMKNLNEAMDVFTDPIKLTNYLQLISDEGLNYANTDVEHVVPIEQYRDVLGGKTFNLPNFGWGESGMAVKDVFEAYKRYFQGDDIESIQNWVNEKSMAWMVVEPEGYKGILHLQINPYLFTKDGDDDLYISIRESWLPPKFKSEYVRPGEFIDIRHYAQPDVYGSVTNVELGKINPLKLGEVLDAVDTLSRHQAGWEINTPYQEIARNILISTYRDYKNIASFDEVLIAKQPIHEGRTPSFELPPSRN